MSDLAAQIHDAAQRLAKGLLVAFPTETVYGLGADASNPDAVAAITGAVPGGARVALSSETLKGWLPETINGMKRETFEVQGGAAMGVAGTTARAGYRDGDRRLDLEVLDAGGAAGILAMISGMQTGERETETTLEKSYQVNKRKYTEKRWKNNQRSELTIVLTNGVMVTAKGKGVPFDELSSAVQALGLDKLEAQQAPAVTVKG